MSFDPNSDLVVRFGAETSDLESGSKRAADAIKQSAGNMDNAFSDLAAKLTGSTEGMKTGLEGLGSVIEGVAGAFTGMAAILAGGAIFAEGIKAASDEAAEVKKLMNSLGMTSEEASKLKIALELVGISAEEYVGIAMKFDRQLRTNEEGLNRLGVVTKDENGHLLAQDKLLQNAIGTMMEYKAGTDRNAVAMALFGRSADEAFKLLKLNDDIKQRASDLAESIGEIVTTEELNNIKQYKIEMAAFGVVADAFSENLGGAVIPGLTEMAKAFMEIAVSIMPAIKAAFEVSGATFKALGDIVRAVVDDTIGLFRDLGNQGHQTFGQDLPDDAMTWGKIMVEVASIITSAKSVIVEALQAIVWAAKQAGNMLASFNDAAAKTIFLGTQGSPIEALRRGMANTRAIDLEYKQQQLENERKYLQELAKIREDYEKSQKGDDKGGHAGNREYKGQDQKNKKGGDTRMSEWEAELMNQQIYADEAGMLYKKTLDDDRRFWEGKLSAGNLTAKELAEIHKRIAQLNRQELIDKMKDQQSFANEEIQRSQETAETKLALEEGMFKRRHDLGLISDTEFSAAEIEFENRRYDIANAGLKKRLALAEKDPNNIEKVRQLYSSIEKLQEQHELKVQYLTTKSIKEQQKKYDALNKGIADGFGKAIGGFIVGTMTWQKAMVSIYQSIQQAFANMIGGMISDWMEGELRKLAISLGILGQKQAADATASVTSSVAKKAEAAAIIPAEAAIAAGGAAESVAAIPIVGPEMAAAAYAETMALVMSGLATASAAGGYDIPPGVNPLTQLHQREMVLPATYADIIRGMAQGGTQGGGDVHLHVSAVDAHSVRRLFEREGGAIADSLKKQVRQFKR